MSVLEAHRDLLRQELATVHREITAAKQEGQSAESIQQLFDRAEYYADCLRKYTKPAVPDHTGILRVQYTQIIVAEQQTQHHKAKLQIQHNALTLLST